MTPEEQADYQQALRELKEERNLVVSTTTELLQLRQEIARLRALVEAAYREGWRGRMDPIVAPYHPKLEDREWNNSNAKAALEKEQSPAYQEPPGDTCGDCGTYLPLTRLDSMSRCGECAEKKEQGHE